MIDVFVDGLKQLHPSGLPIALFVLVDLSHQVDRAVTQRFGSRAARLLDIRYTDDSGTLDDIGGRYSSVLMLRSLANAAGSDGDLADRFAVLVHSNLGQRLTAREIAVSLNCSPSRLRAAVRVALQCSVKAYVLQQRLEAALLLIGDGDKIESVITSVGYRNRTSFFKDFKRRFGMLPSETRASRLPLARPS